SGSTPVAGLPFAPCSGTHFRRRHLFLSLELRDPEPQPQPGARGLWPVAAEGKAGSGGHSVVFGDRGFGPVH
ncbi:unnamed protein product, partial [Musa textilis]